MKFTWNSFWTSFFFPFHDIFHFPQHPEDSAAGGTAGLVGLAGCPGPGLETVTLNLPALEMFQWPLTFVIDFFGSSSARFLDFLKPAKFVFCFFQAVLCGARAVHIESRARNPKKLHRACSIFHLGPGSTWDQHPWQWRLCGPGLATFPSLLCWQRLFERPGSERPWNGVSWSGLVTWSSQILEIA